MLRVTVSCLLVVLKHLCVSCDVVTVDTQHLLTDIGLETRGGVWKQDPFEELNTRTCSTGDTLIDHDICNGNSSVVTRTEWEGRLSKKNEHMGTPTSILFIHHSAGSECFSLAECSREVRRIQDYHMLNKGWDDIGYNFVIGGDGRAYEGRGWDRVGAHTLGWNNISVSLGVMGDYTDHLPTKAALQAVSDLIYRGVALRKLTPDFKLYGHRDARPMFESPGEKLYQLIRTWSHYDPNTPQRPATDTKN